jgi:hypothetical protein
MAADVSADADARTELFTSLRFVTRLANLTVSHPLTLAFVCSPPHIWLVAIRHRLFSAHRSVLHCSTTVCGLSDSPDHRARIAARVALYWMTSRLSCSFRRTYVPSFSTGLTGTVLDACPNNSYMSRLHTCASGRRDLLRLRGPLLSTWPSSLLVMTLNSSGYEISTGPDRGASSLTCSQWERAVAEGATRSTDSAYMPPTTSKSVAKNPRKHWLSLGSSEGTRSTRRMRAADTASAYARWRPSAIREYAGELGGYACPNPGRSRSSG